MKKRASGILIHITSLPSRYGIGDLGPGAYKFADFLVRSGQSYWQILPLNQPADSICPYHCESAFATNKLLISPEFLCHGGFLTKKDIANPPDFPQSQVDFKKVIPYKFKLFVKAFKNFKNTSKKSEYENFCMANQYWLDDYAEFVALRNYYKNHLWFNWPSRVNGGKDKLNELIGYEKFLQFVFYQQWFALKQYCNTQGVKIIGDIPIYVAHDSADVWANREIFKLTKSGKNKFVGGTGPDYFSKTGQLWGNPVYNWPALRKTGYEWWLRRIDHNLKMFDIVRIDHFRAFISYWQVPANHKTAAKGKWMPGGGKRFFDKLFERVSASSIVVEDLGHITPAVRAIVERYNLSGMKVLQFAFAGSDKNPHLPHNYIKNCVAYTGTHDNNTTRGWFEEEMDTAQRKRLSDYVGKKVTADNVSEEILKKLFKSSADTVIVPMQDVLGLGVAARMNRPGTVGNNWSWRIGTRQLTKSVEQRLCELAKTYERF